MNTLEIKITMVERQELRRISDIDGNKNGQRPILIELKQKLIQKYGYLETNKES